MPCTVSRAEKEWYEKEKNKEEYGTAELDERITTAVACEMSKLLEKLGLLSQVSPMAQKWIKNHKKEDKKRG
jgi:hypothetical protein